MAVGVHVWVLCSVWSGKLKSVCACWPSLERLLQLRV